MFALSWLILAATNQEQRHQRLHQQIVTYLCSLQSRSALSYTIIECYAELLLHSRCSESFGSDFIQQLVKQQQCHQGACVKLTEENKNQSVDSRPRYHFVTGLVIDLGR